MGQETKITSVDRELVEQYLSGLEETSTFSEADRERFIRIAVSCQLNPFKREVYLRKSKEKGHNPAQIITGYEVYIRRAEQSSLLDGWKAWIEETKDGLKANVEIRRKDWSLPFIHEVYWNEAVQKNADGSVVAFWERMPRFQLRKVAISQGFRLCFAQELGGFPYEGAELPEQNIPTDSQTGKVLLTDNPIKGTSPAPTATEIVPALVADIHTLAMGNMDKISQNHLEWIENQLRQEKTESQLRGLLKHLQETIDSGGDVTGKQKKPTARRTYPGTTRRPRIPATASVSIPQGTPIF